MTPETPPQMAVTAERAKSWPLAGHAPGHYMNRCHRCDQTFEGDKRAIHCLECAASLVNSRLAQQSAATGGEVREASKALLKEAHRLAGASGDSDDCPHEYDQSALNWIRNRADALAIAALSTTHPNDMARENKGLLQEAVQTIIGRCEALEDEASDALAAVIANSRAETHEAGFWRGQKSTAKSIRNHLHDMTRTSITPSNPPARMEDLGDGQWVDIGPGNPPAPSDPLDDECEQLLREWRDAKARVKSLTIVPVLTWLRDFERVSAPSDGVRYAAIGQTSTIGPRWYIWKSGEGGNFVGGQIASGKDANALAAEMNRLAALTNPAGEGAVRARAPYPVDERAFHVVRRNLCDGSPEIFVAQDRATLSGFPARDRDDAYAMAKSLNAVVRFHVERALAALAANGGEAG